MSPEDMVIGVGGVDAPEAMGVIGGGAEAEKPPKDITVRTVGIKAPDEDREAHRAFKKKQEKLKRQRRVRSKAARKRNRK